MIPPSRSPFSRLLGASQWYCFIHFSAFSNFGPPVTSEHVVLVTKQERIGGARDRNAHHAAEVLNNHVSGLPHNDV